MGLLQVIRDAGSDAARLEDIYQDALKANEAGAFSQAIASEYAEQPANLLYAAWHYRLAYAARAVISERRIPWVLALGLAIANGLVFWLLSDEQLSVKVSVDNYMPYLLLVCAPVAAIFVLSYLSRAGHRRWKLWALLCAVAAVVAVYPLFAYSQLNTVVYREQYLALAMFQVPILAWAIVELFALWPVIDPYNRFAFLIKTLEVLILGGLFAIALGILTGITIILFQALGIELRGSVQRLFVAGGAGLVPVLAVAISYNPLRLPAEQSFDEGISKLIALLMRLLLPVTLLVLFVYIGFIPFNFWKPFENRDVLIIYNVMLFAVMALLVGATPVQTTDIGEQQQRWLRRGLIVLATLAGIVSIYALAAILYRTAQEGITLNRVTFIGWNVINGGLLVLLLAKQRSCDRTTWLPALQWTIAAGSVVYVVWSCVVVFVLPWLF